MYSRRHSGRQSISCSAQKINTPTAIHCYTQQYTSIHSSTLLYPLHCSAQTQSGYFVPELNSNDQAKLNLSFRGIEIKQNLERRALDCVTKFIHAHFKALKI